MKQLTERIKSLFKKDEENSKDALQSVKNWYSERYENMVIQRNLLFLVLIISIVTIAFSVLVIRYIKSTRSIEPFVIEIEQRTGVPTVVEPVDVVVYSGNTAIAKYFIMKYIRAREEYYPLSFDLNYNTIVRVLSADNVYYEYKSKFGIGNPNSPVNLYGQNNYRRVNLKSIQFPKPNIAQVRVSLEVFGMSMNQVMDKIIYMEYSYGNVKMNDEERLINPLGFIVNNYRIDDESGGNK